MSLPVIDLIASFWYSIFGSGFIMTIVIFSLLTIILLTLRANVAVILIVIIPVAVGFLLNDAVSNFVTIPAWIIPVLFMMLGLMFSMFFLDLQR
jgi:uncharacterized membrane protein